MTLFPIEAIVNAANTRLQGGGGVDGAIHRAAGPGLLVELRQLYPNGGVDGGAYYTGAHNIRTTQHIIHTIGPNYRAYEAQGRAAAAHPVLFDAYANSMREAANRGIRSISFPTLSTGIFAFPGEDACKIALSAVKQILDEARVAGYFSYPLELLCRGWGFTGFTKFLARLENPIDYNSDAFLPYVEVDANLYYNTILLSFNPLDNSRSLV